MKGFWCSNWLILVFGLWVMMDRLRLLCVSRLSEVL